jgi:hypothetical protein
MQVWFANQQTTFECPCTNDLYSAILCALQGAYEKNFAPECVGCSGPVSEEDAVKDLKSLIRFLAARRSEPVWRQHFGAQPDTEFVAGNMTFHIMDLPFHCSRSLQPLLPELLEAIRDILRGNAWLGAPCTLGAAPAKSEGDVARGPFCCTYMGSSGCAAYGTGLMLAVLVATARHHHNSAVEIPKVLVDAASAIPGSFSWSTRGLTEQLFANMDASYAAVSVTRKPSDWSFRELVLLVQAEPMQATMSAKELVTAYTYCRKPSRIGS